MRSFFGMVGAMIVGFSLCFVGVITCPYLSKIACHNCVAKGVNNKCACGENCTCAVCKTKTVK
jgi:hypothetical protein